MLKKILAFLVAFCFFPLPCFASPLTDFSSGRGAIDLRAMPYSYVGSDVLDAGATFGLGGDWALNCRYTRYNTDYAGRNYRSENKELNVIRKIDDNWQVYAGFSGTSGTYRENGQRLADRNVFQAGVIGVKKLSDRTKLFTILGGGRNVTNIEFGVSYQFTPGWELTSTYRHLTIEKVGPSFDKENLRGFNLGVTYKF
jgi:predicted porin